MVGGPCIAVRQPLGSGDCPAARLQVAVPPPLRAIDLDANAPPLCSTPNAGAMCCVLKLFMPCILLLLCVAGWWAHRARWRVLTALTPARDADATASHRGRARPARTVAVKGAYASPRSAHAGINLFHNLWPALWEFVGLKGPRGLSDEVPPMPHNESIARLSPSFVVTLSLLPRPSQTCDHGD